jgi:hypothetical protein
MSQRSRCASAAWPEAVKPGLAKGLEDLPALAPDEALGTVQSYRVYLPLVLRY